MDSTQDQSRPALLARLAEARSTTDQVFELVKADSLYERPIPERHRIIFYLGHLDAFDWNLLQSRLPEMKSPDPVLDRLFAFGIDPVGGGLPDDQPKDWPSTGQVVAYNSHVRAALDGALGETSFSSWGGGEQPSVILNTAIEHRLMHAETLAYMLHQLRLDHKRPLVQQAVPQPVAGTAFPPSEMVEIPPGDAALGLTPANADEFGWDNEYKSHTVQVPRFTIDRYKVTNGQYLEFMHAGGYQDRALWTPSDWDWKSQSEITHPAFWKRVGNEWLHRGMFDEIPLPLNWPVYVSHAEASAYAKWSGRRLPTEAEWHRAAFDSSNQKFPGQKFPSTDTQANSYFDNRRWDPLPVNAMPKAVSPFGIEGMLANGWEWTASFFEPFEGFEPFPFYPGYSANFFDGQHYVMKGGSTRTDRCMLRSSFRNWFQANYQYVYAGFRCAA